MIRNQQDPTEKRAAYRCDITYGTNNEFGFDYLRDNLAFSLDDRVQRGLSFAIIDEVDSILIDEARTPLIISGPAEENDELYVKVNTLVPRLKKQLEEDGPGDFSVDEKQKQTHLTEVGPRKRRSAHGRGRAAARRREPVRPAEHPADASPERGAARACDLQARRGIHRARRRSDHRRRIHRPHDAGPPLVRWPAPGRRSEGRREVRAENQTVASITFQNYFRLYKKLSGMTGTADTEAPEFMQIYGLEVVVIPTHRPMIRKDNPDFVYLTQSDKFKAIIEDIEDCVKREQPVLVGTTSIETSELLSGVLKETRHRARRAERQAARARSAHRRERRHAGQGHDRHEHGGPRNRHQTRRQQRSRARAAAAAAGEAGLDEVTAARIRADWQARHDKVLAAGGLHIIGTERHESRRIDNQLRGRSGRQGDPGSSRFYLSMEDNLMRIFGDPDRTKRWLAMAGMKEGEVIESGMLTRQIEKAQRKVEAHNFDVRKQLLTFDDVANDQRKVIYQQRTELMGADNLADADARHPRRSRQRDPRRVSCRRTSATRNGISTALARVDRQEFRDAGRSGAVAQGSARARGVDAARPRHRRHRRDVRRQGGAHRRCRIMRHVEKDIMLKVLDQQWREHLGAMDYLRQGIHLRGYAQKDYRYEYKREAFELFAAMLERIKFDTVTILATLDVQVKSPEQIEREEEARRERLNRALQAQHAEAASLAQLGAAGDERRRRRRRPGARAGAAAAAAAGRSSGRCAPRPRSGRNQPCPCGSGKKFKNCHGVLEGVE